MSKQDKKIKKAKAGKKKAEEIIEAEVSKIKSKKKDLSDHQWAGERVEGISDEEFELGCKVRQLRDEGQPWWAIARDLEMEGAGDSATSGKKGAARARTAYAKAFGSHPRTFKKGSKGFGERNEHVKALKAKKQAERKAEAMAGRSVISADVPDEEVAAMLKGRLIRWWVQGPDISPEGFEQSAVVHPQATMYIEGEGDERVIQFREQHRRAPADVRWMPAQTRSVRLSKIFSVR